MRYRDAKKLHKGDQVLIKGTDRIETVNFIEDHEFTVYIYTCEGSDYHHTEVQ
jgi:hypothetical protein